MPFISTTSGDTASIPTAYSEQLRDYLKRGYHVTVDGGDVTVLEGREPMTAGVRLKCTSPANRGGDLRRTPLPQHNNQTQIKRP